jgi:hypothetical protein
MAIEDEILARYGHDDRIRELAGVTMPAAPSTTLVARPEPRRPQARPDYLGLALAPWKGAVETLARPLETITDLARRGGESAFGPAYGGQMGEASIAGLLPEGAMLARATAPLRALSPAPALHAAAYGRPLSQEKVAAPVVKVGNQMFEGINHGEAMDKALKAGALTPEMMAAEQAKPGSTGINADLFRTNSGRIIGRKEAEKLAGAGESDALMASGKMTPPALQPLLDALKAAKPVRKEQEALYSAERSRRVGAAMGAMKRGGREGYFAALGQLRGELPKAQFSSVANAVTPEQIDVLFSHVQDSRLTPFEKITAQSGLQKLLGVQGGVVPQEGELALLHEVFGPELVSTVKDLRPAIQKHMDTLLELGNVPRSLMASFDFSAPFRQGGTMVTRPEWYKAWGPMFKSFASEPGYQALRAEIQSRPTYALMREGNLALTDNALQMGSREERFASNMAERIPFVGRLVRASDRAYTGFLNRLRADSFDSVLKNAKAAGVDVTDPTFLQGLGNWVNTATGRGPLGGLQSAAPVLNATFFSPRLFASRVANLNPAFYVNLPPAVRKEAVRNILATGAAWTTLLGVAAAGGAKVVSDPRNADFGKIRVGNTRYDLMAGHQQLIRLAAQLASGQVVSSTTGKVMTLSDQKAFRPMTRKDVALRFVEAKEAPIASFVTDWLEGRNFEGQPFNAGKEVAARFIPMAAGDVKDAMDELGIGPGIAAAAPGMVGLGVQTYGPSVKVGDKKVQLRQEDAARFEQQMREALAQAASETAEIKGPEKRQKFNRLVDRYQGRVRREWQNRMALRPQAGKAPLTVNP